MTDVTDVTDVTHHPLHPRTTRRLRQHPHQHQPNGRPRLLGGLALATVLACAVLPGPAFAQAAVAIELAPQPLGEALLQLGRQTSLQFFYPSALVQGIVAPGVSGTLTPEQALQRLLAGSGLVYRRDGDSIMLSRVPAAGSTSNLLPEVTVTAQGQGSVTENSGSYTSGATSVATKLATSLKETPRSVSVMTNQQLKDQGLEGKNLEEALRWAPGITLDDTVMGGYAASTADTNMPQIYSRGQQITNLQIDGITYDLNGAESNSSTRRSASDFSGLRASGLLGLPDMVLFDHVEIVRGPNSVFSGNGTPSATLNMVRKRPLKDFQLIGELSGTSWRNNAGHIAGRGTVDVTGALPVMDGRLRGRFLASKADGAASFLAHHDSERETVYAALEADLTPDTVLGLNFSKEKTDTSGQPVAGGLPRYHWGEDIGLPVGSNFTSPDVYTRSDNEHFQLYLNHRINERWHVAANFSHMDQRLDSLGLNWLSSNIDEDGRGGRLSISRPMQREGKQNSFDVRLNGDFNILGRQTSLLFGMDFKDMQGAASYDSRFINGGAEIADIRRYDYRQTLAGDYEPLIGTYAFNDTQTEKGLYASLKVNVTDPLNLFISGRYARFQSKSIAQRPSGVPWGSYSHDSGENAQPITPTYAITYDLGDKLTAFVSHSRSYQDQSFYRKGTLLDASNPWGALDSGAYVVGGTVDPIIGKNWELGLNGAFLNGRLNANATLFHTKRTGIVVDAGFGPSGTTAELGFTSCCWVNAGEQASKGLDIGLSGEVYPGVQLSAGYTFNKNKTLLNASGLSASFRSHTRSPEHQLKLWGHYQPGGAWRKWNFGAGIVAQSKAYSSGTAAEYLGYDPDYEWKDPDGNPTGDTGRSVWSNEAYYADGAHGGFNPGAVYTLPYDFTQQQYGVVSASVGYQLHRTWYAQLNIDNVFDKRYYRTIGTATDGNYYGAPRSFTLTLRATFD